MRGLPSLLSMALATASFAQLSLAQTAGNYTDPGTGIKFDTWTVSTSSSKGGMTIGLSLPGDALTTDATEFIGLLTCSMPSAAGQGWCGISMAGAMTNSLLLMAWPSGGDVLTGFRWATGYNAPTVYQGNTKLTQISSTINSTHYSILFRCENCLAWTEGSTVHKTTSSSGLLVLGWAQSTTSPVNGGCAADASVAVQHDNGEGIFGAQLNAFGANAQYGTWAALATKTVTGSCGGSTSTTTTSTSTSTATATVVPQPVPKTTFDYIVVGGGAGGIPLADKLSEAGKSVLLIEKGPPSSGRWGGTMKPGWLGGTNLTRFDVPGLCNEIWVDSKGIACDDTDQMAGCVLGGGTAVNAGLWWKPYPLDWDYNFPTGWKSSDMSAATSRVFSRIPGTDTPSMDGQLYYQQGFNVLSGGLKAGGWSSITPNSSPAQKNHTYGHTPFMFSNGERGGPMATYLVSAKARSNFQLWTGTRVKRVIRTGGHITGVEVEAFLDGGYAGVVNVTSVTGRVVLSAGTFGTPKILNRSGIGRSDQLAVVATSTDGPTMIKNDSWLILPVGDNLVDHVNTDTVITHPDVQFYDFYAAWDNPIAADKSAYLNKRSGILAQAAPNIGPMFWDEIKGSDGIVRQIQWTARVEGSNGTPNGKAMTLSQYLGRGSTSRGQMSITASLSTYVSTLPYLRDAQDKAAVVKGIENLQAALSTVKNLTFTYPAPGTSAQKFVDDMIVSYSNRRANHWMGTCKMGTDDARTGGTAVVDTNTKVWGTDNLFVVDASIFPGMVTTNPSAYIVTVAERAAERILALANNQVNAHWGQCGGRNWNGSYMCVAPYTCQYVNEYYSQCL